MQCQSIPRLWKNIPTMKSARKVKEYLSFDKITSMFAYTVCSSYFQNVRILFGILWFSIGSILRVNTKTTKHQHQNARQRIKSDFAASWLNVFYIQPSCCLQPSFVWLFLCYRFVYIFPRIKSEYIYFTSTDIRYNLLEFIFNFFYQVPLLGTLELFEFKKMSRIAFVFLFFSLLKWAQSLMTNANCDVV